jgi:hypothetical protein
MKRRFRSVARDIPADRVPVADGIMVDSRESEHRHGNKRSHCYFLYGVHRLITSFL